MSSSAIPTPSLDVRNACTSVNSYSIFLLYRPRSSKLNVIVKSPQITHTPMILAPEFSRAQTARISDFKTSSKERGSFWMRRRRRRSDLLSDDLDEPEESRSGSESSNRNGNQHLPENLHLYDKTAPRRPDPTTRPSKDHELVRGLLIAQFASNNGASLADACEIINVKPTIDASEDKVGSGEFVGKPKRTFQPQEDDGNRRLVDGVDLNCVSTYDPPNSQSNTHPRFLHLQGCPQPWAYSEGIGSALLRKPHIVADMVRQVNERMGSDFGISVKIRVDDDLKLTERLVQTGKPSPSYRMLLRSMLMPLCSP
jgi:tRNA-dihydrouridine synthase 4